MTEKRDPCELYLKWNTMLVKARVIMKVMTRNLDAENSLPVEDALMDQMDTVWDDMTSEEHDQARDLLREVFFLAYIEVTPSGKWEWDNIQSRDSFRMKMARNPDSKFYICKNARDPVPAEDYDWSE